MSEWLIYKLILSLVRAEGREGKQVRSKKGVRNKKKTFVWYVLGKKERKGEKKNNKSK